MTMLLTAALLCGTLLYALRQVLALADRALSLRERADARAAQTPEKLRIPPDLLTLADEQSEPWAQEQMRSALREAFEELGEWDLVRAKLNRG